MTLAHEVFTASQPFISRYASYSGEISPVHICCNCSLLNLQIFIFSVNSFPHSKSFTKKSPISSTTQMAGVTVAANQTVENTPEGVIVSELINIMKFSIRPLRNEELVHFMWGRTRSMIPTPWRSRLTTTHSRISNEKLMKFITTEPERFHPYLVAKFYRKAIITSDSTSFKTKVYNT